MRKLRTKLKRGDAFCPECGAQVIKMRRSERQAISPSKTMGGVENAAFLY